MSVVTEFDAVQRKRYFILLRLGLVLITGLLGYLATEGDLQAPLLVLLALALLSNLYLLTLSPFTFFDVTMQSTVLIADTALISGLLLLARAGQEFFLFFFFALLMVAYIENAVLLVAAAAFIGLLSLFLPDVKGGVFSPAFLRIPFLLATTIFYAYIVLPDRPQQTVLTKPVKAWHPPRPPVERPGQRMPQIR